jgi:hypothetical protein
MTSLKDYNAPQYKTFGVIMFILFWVGLVLTGFGMYLWDSVAMPLYVALLLWLAPGVILTPYLNKFLPSKKLKGVAKFMVALFANIIAFGGIMLYGVLALDYYPANSTPPTVKIIPVMKYGYTESRSGDKSLCADIRYQNYMKQIDFSEYELTDSNRFHHVQLQTTPGYLGFEVIRSKKLVK